MDGKKAPSVVRTRAEMKKVSRDCAAAGKRLGFVPTMGALHPGHLSLVDEAVARADVAVVSVFVNPSQFGPGEDFDRYGRDFEGDLEKLAGSGVDYLFHPAAEEIYPDGFQTAVSVGELGDRLCGPARPGHFDGVATVVLKLFNVVRPDFAVFGEKDYQQLVIVRRMARDFDVDVEIVAMPIRREPDGLAMSSRNVYLSAEQRTRAAAINRALREVGKMFEGGCRDCPTLLRAAERVLREAQINDIDYLEIADPVTLEFRTAAERGDLVAVAARIGETRLIDNVLL